MSYNRVVTGETLELFQASERGDAKAAASLAEHPSTDVNWHRTQSYGATPIIAAIMNGHKDVVEILFNANADIGALKTPDRNSPLHEAAFRDEPEIMQLILSKIELNNNQPISALVDLQNQFGNTPLHNAARTGNAGCVANLLKADAKVTIKNVNGSLPLHHACYCEKPNLAIVKLLVDAGSDVNDRNEQGYTPMIIAAKKNQTDVIDYLRSHGADAKLKNAFGEDALHFATLRENTNATELLSE
ncbi:26s proteasome regulatory complex, subunit psmd10, partial [Globisporangium splendens]